MGTDRQADGEVSETEKPFGLCERDADGMCTGKCGRRGHLGRPLSIDEWLHYFGTNARKAVSK